MVNPNKIISDFKIKGVEYFLANYNFTPLQYQMVFPELFRTSLSWKTIEAATGASVLADVVAFNSSAPRKGRPMPGSAIGDMPKIEAARDMFETDLITLQELQNALASASSQTTRIQIGQEIINLMYGDSAFVVNAVNSRLEWIAKQIASTGKYSLTLTNNEAGIQTKTDVDFGIPAANKINAAKNWFTDADADPVSDIYNRQKAALANGYSLKYMYMDRETFNAMANKTSVQKFSASYLNNALNTFLRPSVETLNIALTAQALPVIIVWDSFVSIEGKDGDKTSTSGWEAGKVTFSETPELGNTQYAVTADERADNADGSVKVKSGIVLVKTWGTAEPLRISTKGVVYGTPVLNNVKRIHILSTKF